MADLEALLDTVLMIWFLIIGTASANVAIREGDIYSHVVTLICFGCFLVIMYGAIRDAARSEARP